LAEKAEPGAGWASAAGYNVGKMYEELNESMISLPTPSDLTADQGQIYRELVRTKVFILLEKAEKTWSQTAEMVTRTGADSEWGVKTRASLARIRARIADEGTAVAAAEDDDSGSVFSSLIGAKAGALSSSAASAAAAALRYASGQMPAIVAHR
jgi:hypothetical protein